MQYIGAGLAVGLFAMFAPLTVAWLRSVIAAVFLLAWRRPWARGFLWGRGAQTRAELGWALLFGSALVAMNSTFYEAIARLPLGTTVSLEFVGPVIFAAIGMTGLLGKLSVVVAFVGVVLIGGLGIDLGDPAQLTGMFWSFVAGAAWVLYMILGRKVAAAGRGMDALAVGMAFGSFLQLPFAWGEVALVAVSPKGMGLAVTMAMCSSVIPYVLEQVVLRGVTAPLFALLSALLPVTSLLVGLVMLGQIPNWAEVAGLVCVSVAVAMSYRPQK